MHLLSARAARWAAPRVPASGSVQPGHLRPPRSLWGGTGPAPVGLRSPLAPLHAELPEASRVALRACAGAAARTPEAQLTPHQLQTQGLLGPRPAETQCGADRMADPASAALDGPAPGSPPTELHTSSRRPSLTPSPRCSLSTCRLDRSRPKTVPSGPLGLALPGSLWVPVWDLGVMWFAAVVPSRKERGPGGGGGLTQPLILDCQQPPPVLPGSHEAGPSLVPVLGLILPSLFFFFFFFECWGHA